MITIENELIRVRIAPKGAELQSVINKSNGIDYIWPGDPAFWAKHSPVLFPIVGTLKGNRYYYKGQTYDMGRHGFARDKEFEAKQTAADTATFILQDDQETRRQFPFSFRLEITYTLAGASLQVGYAVHNTGAGAMFFSIGGHPAFRVPIRESFGYDDYYLQFEKPETAGRWPISKDGLIEASPVPLLNGTNKLPLTKALFSKDALVLKHLVSDSVDLRTDKDAAGLSFSLKGFPFLGIWAAPRADFVCIEPWCGIADSVNASQQLEEKEGIERLEADRSFKRTWRITLF
ncbi:MAG: aldose 1-epimerase family protein [Bacteroidota bacterium]|nr:aldose 1-epimerase family protein [Bacteroidota bacterium]